MDFQIKDVLTWVGLSIGVVGTWFRNQYKVERLSEKDDDQGRQIEAMWKWKDLHEKELAITWQNFSKEIAELRGSLMVTNEQFKQIMGILNDIKDRMYKLEVRQSGRNAA